MKQEMILNENEMNNPLYRKMKERFLCNGRFTIGEIMLHRAQINGCAESDEYSMPTNGNLSVTPKSTVVPRVKKNTKSVIAKEKVSSNKTTEKAKETSTGTFKKSSHVFITSIALTICILVLLAIMVPVLANLPISAQKVGSLADEGIHTVPTGTSVGDIPAEVEVVNTPVVPEASFENVMDAFSSSFGD